jgi:hypothetical protein
MDKKVASPNTKHGVNPASLGALISLVTFHIWALVSTPEFSIGLAGAAFCLFAIFCSFFVSFIGAYVGSVFSRKENLSTAQKVRSTILASLLIGLISPPIVYHLFMFLINS